MQEVDVQALDVARLESLIGHERMARFELIADEAQAALAGRTVINVNSTAKGGGVAEMLQTLLAYVRGAGIDARWLVIEGDAQFFAITKRIHNGIYGFPGDGGPLGKRERRHYESVLRANAEELRTLVRPGDVVLLHDPQPLGLAGELRRAGAAVVWRCHIGCDRPNEWTERAWEFLRPYAEEVQAHVVSRAAFAPPFCAPESVRVIPPSIDPFSAKNEPMSHRNVRLALGYVGLTDGDGSPPVVPYTRRDGSPGRIDRHVDVVQSGPSPPADAPLIVQASRWDAMKDMAGVMDAFAHHVDPAHGAHLVLAGPAVKGVADDPEAVAVYDECIERWRELPHATRGRVHLVCVPMVDPDENAAIVNALQRHAAVVTQKSLAEGFGLTVTEAMWKARPVVASAVGGIADQIEHERHGLLVEDPNDLPGFARAVERLLTDRDLSARLGAAARQRVLAEFLGDRHLEQWGALFQSLRPTRQTV
jgi:trehalose synthase